MTPVKVVCGIICKEDQVFIARRKSGKTLEGFWEFPGGKLEKDEAPEAALVRELLEELGMQVSVIDYFGSSVYDYDTFSIELIAYNCKFISASYLLTDHDEFVFVKPAELSNYKIAPADLFIVKKIVNL
jgi:8-oxo-dGTP diphosphatase